MGAEDESKVVVQVRQDMAGLLGGGIIGGGGIKSN
jgi:hypothetical protein